MAQMKSRAVPQRSGLPPEAELSDGQLLGHFTARRDAAAEAAFAALIRRHGPMVLRVCGQVLGDPHAAEDAFQASFLVLARRAGSIREPELLGNWLYGVALRTAREAKLRDGRRRRREAPAAVAARREAPGDPGRPDAALIGREERAALHEELARLPERYRVPLVLCELEGLTYQEAARRLRCPVSTVGVRLVRARERLRGRMIRRGVAPAVATATANALPWPAGAAEVAATGLVEAAARGQASAAAVALAGAVLRALRIDRLKAAAGTVAAAGLAATLGWVAACPPIPPAPAGSRPAPGPPAAAAAGEPDLAIRLVEDGGPPRAPAADPAPIPIPAPAAGPAEVADDAGRPAGPIVAPAGFRPAGRAEVARGEALFLKEWAVRDPSSPGGDGLGPLYNDTSCVACHGQGGPGGAGPERKNVVVLAAVASHGRGEPRRLDQVHPGFRNARSTVLHRYGVDPSYPAWRREFVEVHCGGRPPTPASSAPAREESVDERIRRFAAQARPGGGVRGLAGRLSPRPGVTLKVSERNSPALFGVGRIDSIPGAVILDEARSQPAETRGRASRMRDGRVGRFGWKGQIAGLHEFVRGACASELGLEVPGHAQAASPLGPPAPAAGLDLTDADCDALVSYVRALPSPVAVDPDGPHGTSAMAAGRRAFAEVGCAACHVPSLGEVRGIYSDLLLHDLGSSLGDTGSSYGGDEGPDSPDDPGPGEWRTPPLWGFRDSGPYLHDGRAETLDEAVALHEGQALTAARCYFALDAAARAGVESFLKSLVAPTAASTPGIVLAAELEARAVPEEDRRAEAEIRRRRQLAEAGEVEEREEVRRRQAAEAALRRAFRNYQLAVNLERSGKFAGALRYYGEVAREAPDSHEGRASARRIVVLTTLLESL